MDELEELKRKILQTLRETEPAAAAILEHGCFELIKASDGTFDVSVVLPAGSFYASQFEQYIDVVTQVIAVHAYGGESSKKTTVTVH